MKKKLISKFLVFVLLFVAVFNLAGCKKEEITEAQVEFYKITFNHDENVSVEVFSEPNYTSGRTKIDYSYAMDHETGKLSVDGFGEVNFKLVFKDGYCLNDLELSKEFRLKTPDETGVEDCYTILNITEDATLSISSKKAPNYIDFEGATMLTDFGSTTTSLGECNFTFKSINTIPLSKIEVEVYENTNKGEPLYTTTLSGNATSFSYNLTKEKLYVFRFRPFSSLGNEGQAVSVTRYFNNDLSTSSMPRVDIKTKDGIFPSHTMANTPEGADGYGIENNNYEQAIVNVYNKAGSRVYNSASGISQQYSGAKIKVRGNASARTQSTVDAVEKDPYKIKLTNKADLLDGLTTRDVSLENEDTDWLLLPENGRFNELVGFTVSKIANMNYVPSFCYVSLFLNGDFRGIYILCEAVNKGNGTGESQSRVKISSDGFLVECNLYWWQEDLYFSTPFLDHNLDLRYTLKSPNPEKQTKNSIQFNYIKNYICEFEEALNRDDDSYLDYIDLDSWVRWLVIQDVIKVPDYLGSNIYLYKYDSTDSSKLCLGPVWDFDGVLGSFQGFANVRVKDNFYFTKLLQKQSFATKYLEVYNEIKTEIVFEIGQVFDNLEISESIKRADKTRWGYSSVTLSKRRSEVVSWLGYHIEWMDNELGINE